MHEDNYTDFSTDEIEYALRRKYDKLSWIYSRTHAEEKFSARVNNITFEVECSDKMQEQSDRIIVRFFGEVVASFAAKFQNREGYKDTSLSRLIQEQCWTQASKELEMFLK